MGRACRRQSERTAFACKRNGQLNKVGGVHKVDALESFGEQFGLHPLLSEDIANTDQRPNLDDYEAYFPPLMKVLVVRMGSSPEFLRGQRSSRCLQNRRWEGSDTLCSAG
jgi:hypothetical protein